MSESNVETAPAIVRGLSEVALRVKGLPAMQRFYQEVVGLELLRRFEAIAFFKIVEGFCGHTQVLALFSEPKTSPLESIQHGATDSARTTLQHLALEIPLEDYQVQKQLLERRVMKVTTQEHPWVGWRSLYVADPEWYVVEFVYSDRSILDKPLWKGASH